MDLNTLPPPVTSQPPTPEAPKRSRWAWLKRSFSLPVWALALAVGGSFAVGQAAGTEKTVTVEKPVEKRIEVPGPTVTKTIEVPARAAATAPAPAPAPAPVPAGPRTTISDGQWKVGTEVAAGQYKTDGPRPSAPGGMCYYERRSSAGNDVAGVIENELPRGQSYVTISDGEYFKTQGCQPWVKVD